MKLQIRLELDTTCPLAEVGHVYQTPPGGISGTVRHLDVRRAKPVSLWTRIKRLVRGK